MSVYWSIYKLYLKMQQRMIPELESAQNRYQRVLEEIVSEDTHILDLGCGWHFLREHWAGDERKLLGRIGWIVGVDVDEEAIRRHRSIRSRVLGDAGRLPFAERSFDLVTANMVVEHLSAPREQFAEIRRVLKPGGIFLFHTPNLDGYIARMAQRIPEALKGGLASVLEARSSEDVYQTHYLANTEQDIREAAGKAGLEVASLDHVTTVAQTSIVLPVAFFELLWLRKLERTPELEKRRTNLIVQLKRPGS